MCLSNVHNTIMTLKMVSSKLSTELLLPIPVNELLYSHRLVLGLSKTCLVYLFLNVLILFALKTEDDKLFHIFTILSENENFLRS